MYSTEGFDLAPWSAMVSFEIVLCKTADNCRFPQLNEAMSVVLSIAVSKGTVGNMKETGRREADTTTRDVKRFFNVRS
jgi:hypothetical protein